MKKKFNPFTQNFDLVPFETYSKATDPTPGDDSQFGFAVGDEWTNYMSKAIFKCIDNAAGAAVWFNFVDASAVDKNKTFQFVNQTQKVIVHNFGKYPSVTVVDQTGEEIEVEVIYDSINQCTINLNTASSGVIILN